MIIQKETRKKIGVEVLPKKHPRNLGWFYAVVKLTNENQSIEVKRSADAVIKAIKIMKKMNKEDKK